MAVSWGLYGAITRAYHVKIATNLDTIRLGFASGTSLCSSRLEDGADRRAPLVSERLHAAGLRYAPHTRVRFRRARANGVGAHFFSRNLFFFSVFKKHQITFGFQNQNHSNQNLYFCKKHAHMFSMYWGYNFQNLYLKIWNSLRRHLQILCNLGFWDKFSKFHNLNSNTMQTMMQWHDAWCKRKVLKFCENWDVTQLA